MAASSGWEQELNDLLRWLRRTREPASNPGAAQLRWQRKDAVTVGNQQISRSLLDGGGENATA